MLKFDLFWLGWFEFNLFRFDAKTEQWLEQWFEFKEEGKRWIERERERATDRREKIETGFFN